MEISKQQEISIFTPIDALFSEYDAVKKELEEVCGYAKKRSGAMFYLIRACSRKNKVGAFHVDEIFNESDGVASLDAGFWQRAINLTDVLSVMDATARNKWNESISNCTTPSFNEETVVPTIRGLLADRSKFFTDRVDGLFQCLSGEHVTNQPQGFSKRMIINYFLNEWGSIDWKRSEYVEDLRYIISTFSDRGRPDRTREMLRDLVMHEPTGKWLSCDGGAWRIKWFKKGTIHIEIHPDLAWRMNKILASKYPTAIPESFKRKPKKEKKVKDFVMREDALSYDTLNWLMSLAERDRRVIALGDASKEIAYVLDYLGGKRDGSSWTFDYSVNLAIKEICRSGVLPERVSHQFYPTPPELAEFAVSFAEIKEGDECLEPSAGQGGIAEYMPAGTNCIEISEFHCEILKAKGLKAECADFLSSTVTRKYDIIILNPPFSEGRAKAHTEKAYECLKEGGTLVAILPASFADKEIIKGADHKYSQVFKNGFSHANVDVVMGRIKNGKK